MLKILHILYCFNHSSNKKLKTYTIFTGHLLLLIFFTFFCAFFLPVTIFLFNILTLASVSQRVKRYAGHVSRACAACVTAVVPCSELAVAVMGRGEVGWLGVFRQHWITDTNCCFRGIVNRVQRRYSRSVIGR